ncbi:hypothetical protein [Pseudomonas sp.]|uniref:hypothetical protein n=1 Tax=Pseudomonas sp. TaxID=306 RepID=UPI00290DE2DB|nr:hypothetical protein [Pseudomonas sp.]MDU4254526.1 hypothetical protein [Pseudomonas sp.]
MTDKFPTTLRAYADQRAAEAKNDSTVEPLGRPRVFSVSPLDIVVYPERNIRPIEPETVEKYKAAFLRGDKFPPVHVSMEKGQIVLKHGYHRTLAAQELVRDNPDMAHLQLELTEFKGNAADCIIMMLNAQDSLDVDPVSRAEAYLALLNQGLSLAKIAVRIGKSDEHVSQQLLLVEADEPIKALIRSKSVSATTVIQLIEEEKQGSKPHGAVVAEMVKNAEAVGAKKATLKHRTTPATSRKPKIGQVRASLKSLLVISDSLREALNSAPAATATTSPEASEAEEPMVALSLPAAKVAELLALLDGQAGTKANPESSESSESAEDTDQPK